MTNIELTYDANQEQQALEAALHDGGIHLVQYLERLCTHSGVANDVGYECVSVLNNIASKYKQQVRNSIMDLQAWQKKYKSSRSNLVQFDDHEEQKLQNRVDYNLEMYQIAMRESMLLSRKVRSRVK